MGVIAVVGMLTVVLFIGLRASVSLPVAFAIGLQALLAVAFYYIFGLSGDATAYESSARELVVYWTGEGALGRIAADGKQSLVVIVAILYWLGPPHPLVALLFLSALQGLLPSVLYLSTVNFGFRRSARTAAWVAAILPQIALWSPWLRREGLSFVLLGLLVLSFSMVYREQWLQGACVGAVGVSMLWWTRPQLVLVWTAGMTVTALSCLAKRMLTRQGRVTFDAFAIPLFLIGASVLVAGVSLGASSAGEVLNRERVEQIVRSNSAPTQELAVYTVEELGTEREDMWTNWAPRVLMVLGPWPTEWQTIGRAVAGLDGVALLITYGLAVALAATKPGARWMVTILLSSTVPLMVGIAVTLANWGIVSRVRAHVFVLLIPALAVLIHETVAQWRNGTLERDDTVES